MCDCYNDFKFRRAPAPSWLATMTWLYWIALGFFWLLHSKVALVLAQNETDYIITLEPAFNPSACIVAGTTVKLTCTVYDPQGHGATIWTGSETIFNCPSANSIESDQLFLRHSQTIGMTHPVSHCGCLITAELYSMQNSSMFISTISITTTSDMNGGYVRCSDLLHQDQQQILLTVAGLYNFFVHSPYIAKSVM